MLLVASYEEDKAGVVQRSFAQTLSLFALIDAALEVICSAAEPRCSAAQIFNLRITGLRSVGGLPGQSRSQSTCWNDIFSSGSCGFGRKYVSVCGLA